MSAAAGVLGIELEKIGHYRLGGGQPKPTYLDIGRAQSLLWCTALLAIAATSVILLAIE
jgi:adenosylcobinamide-phosphate synthase